MQFAFLVHPISEAATDLFRLDNGGELLQHWGSNLLQFTSHLHRRFRETSPTLQVPASAAPRLIDRQTGLVSASGASAEGRLYEIPMDVPAILADPDRALCLMEQAMNDAAAWGAQLIGLGSMTGIVGGHGVHMQQRGRMAVTTGNSLTVFAAVDNLRNLCVDLGIDLSKETVAIVGVPGSIATACARVLQPHCRQLLLVGRQASVPATRIASQLQAPLLLDIPQALGKARIIISATSSGNCIDPDWLLPGSIVIDVGVPTDVRGGTTRRRDVLILSGGLARVPGTFARDSLFLRFFSGMVPCCLGETMVLALENRAESWSIGRDLDLARIAEIGALALKHGFDFTPLLSFGLPVEPGAIAEILKARTRVAMAKPSNGEENGKASAPLPPMPVLARHAARRFERFINPAMAGLGEMSGLVKTFVRGQGNELFDVDGRAYLDFCAGYGALNLGHNHPAVVRAIQETLAQQTPGFTPAAIHPLAATLAAKLVALSPSGLEMVFLCNSGTEAVEAALKLARAATGRTALLHCNRSFHGKSMGSLSVTGNPAYQRPFGPLVPDCEAVPFGDEEALARALERRSFAAFIVEPIQGEGGMNVPPPNYLRAAEVLCRRAGTLLIVDEVQTGLGRTGAMFAIEHAGIEPDLLTLAKSLGGGLVPIGAMLARRDLWKRAYGTAQTFALHSTTFGGGSLACAAALAALDVLSSQHLPECAERRGRELLAGLEALRDRFPVVREVRGQGLLLGIEFEPLSPDMIRHFHAADGAGEAAWFVPHFDENLQAFHAFYAMHALLESHAIFTQTARSHPLVLRVQPPLTITSAEIQRFLHALEQVCTEMSSFKDIMDPVVSRSIGEIGLRAEEPAAALRRETGSVPGLPEAAGTGAVPPCAPAPAAANPEL